MLLIKQYISWGSTLQHQGLNVYLFHSLKPCNLAKAPWGLVTTTLHRWLKCSAKSPGLLIIALYGQRALTQYSTKNDHFIRAALCIINEECMCTDKILYQAEVFHLSHLPNNTISRSCCVDELNDAVLKILTLFTMVREGPPWGIPVSAAEI